MLDMNLLNKFDLGVFNNLDNNTKEYIFRLSQGDTLGIEVGKNEYSNILEMSFLLGKHGVSPNDKYPCLAKLNEYCIVINSDIITWKNVPNSLVEEFLKEILEKNN